MESVQELPAGFHQTDPTPAAACFGFDQQRISDPVRLFQGSRRVGDDVAAGRHRDSGLPHGSAGLVFIPHPADHLRTGTDKGDVALFTKGNKLCVFRQQPVSGMDSLSPGNHRHCQNRRHI